MIKQKQIAKILGRKQPTISLLLSGEREMSWPLAGEMVKLFGKTREEWKTASPDQIRAAFNTIPAPHRVNKVTDKAGDTMGGSGKHIT